MEESSKAVLCQGLPSSAHLPSRPCSDRLGDNSLVPQCHSSSNKKQWFLGTSKYPLTSVWTAKPGTWCRDIKYIYMYKIIPTYIILLVQAHRREHMKVPTKWQSCHLSLTAHTTPAALHLSQTKSTFQYLFSFSISILYLILWKNK